MEQRLIDANKLRADICKWLKPSIPDETEFVAIDDIGESVCEEIEEQPTVFTIPENPTNGDMIQAMFPNAPIDTELYTYYVTVKLDYHTQDDGGLMFDKGWWNAPYKKE